MNRDEFMELVYETFETFADEPDNVLANGIIEAADAYAEHEKAQLSQQGTTSDLISRTAAQTEVMMKCERYTLARESHGMGHVEWSSDLISVGDAMDAIRDLPPAQPERAIPLSWIEKYIEWLKGFDNEFANLEAAHISVMVKKWRDEQDEDN